MYFLQFSFSLSFFFGGASFFYLIADSRAEFQKGSKEIWWGILQQLWSQWGSSPPSMQSPQLPVKLHSADPPRTGTYLDTAIPVGLADPGLSGVRRRLKTRIRHGPLPGLAPWEFPRLRFRLLAVLYPCVHLRNQWSTGSTRSERRTEKREQKSLLRRLVFVPFPFSPILTNPTLYIH